MVLSVEYSTVYSPSFPIWGQVVVLVVVSAYRVGLILEVREGRRRYSPVGMQCAKDRGRSCGEMSKFKCNNQQEQGSTRCQSDGEVAVLMLIWLIYDLVKSLLAQFLLSKSSNSIYSFNFMWVDFDSWNCCPLFITVQLCF